MDRLTNFLKSTAELQTLNTQSSYNYVVLQLRRCTKRPITCSELIDENPKVKIKHTYLELGTFRNRKVWGGRRICITAFIFRKRSSFVFLSKLIIKEFDVDEKLKTLKKNLKIKNFNTNYSGVVSNKNFLIACCINVKFIENSEIINLNSLTKIWFINHTRKIQNNLSLFFETYYAHELKSNKKIKLSIKLIFKIKIIFEGIKFFLKIAFNSTINKHPYDYQSNFGSHVTLNNTKKTCKTVYKYIESSISQQFKLSNYDLLLSLLKSRIKDRIFTNLICEYLKIKFCKFSKNIFMSAENTQKNTIFSILHDIQNVFFDSWVKKKLLIDFNKRKKFNFKYFRFYKIKFNNKSSILRPISDLKHRHAHYFRYLNNFTVGVNGSKRNCMKILKKIRNFLKKKLNLNLNVNQTEINCVENKSILLFDFTIQKTKLKKVLSLVRKNKIFKCDIFKFIFKTFVANIINKLKFEGYIKNNRPICNIKLINNQLTEITKHYKIIERKILDYYFFFDNFKIVAVQIRYMLKSSYILTIASKMKFKTKKQVFREYNKI